MTTNKSVYKDFAPALVASGRASEIPEPDGKTWKVEGKFRARRLN